MQQNGDEAESGGVNWRRHNEDLSRTPSILQHRHCAGHSRSGWRQKPFSASG